MLVLTVVAFSGAASLGAVGTAAAASTYGPPWGRFVARFKQAPLSSGDVAHELRLPGLTAAYAYAVTTNKTPFSSTSPLTVPTVEVVVFRYRTAADAKKALTRAKSEYRSEDRLTIDGGKGFTGVQITSPSVTAGTSATTGVSKSFDYLGETWIVQGRVAFEALANTSSQSTTSSFLQAFRVAH
jgi:hypothetical protein